MKELMISYAVGFQEPIGFICEVAEKTIQSKQNNIVDENTISKIEKLISEFEWDAVKIRQTSHGPFPMPCPKLTIHSTEYDIKKINEDNQLFYVKNAKEEDVLELRQLFENICR